MDNRLTCEQGSSVGIAADYGLGDPGSNPGRDEIFPPVQTGPGAHPASCKMGTVVFPGGKERPGRAGDHSPLPVPHSMINFLILTRCCGSMSYCVSRSPPGMRLSFLTFRRLTSTILDVPHR